MKHYLFIDNFRGFSDTCIPIADVNFLVGENSTGKTSVLGLLKLFGNAKFLAPQAQSEFADEHVSFGHFGDMVSAHATERSHFHVGFIAPQPSTKEAEPPRTAAWLCTFVEHKGLPRLSHLTFCQGSGKLTLQITNHRIRFTTSTFPTPPNAEEIARNCLAEWKEEHRNPKLKYRTIDFGSLRGRLPLFIILGLVRGASDTSSKKGDSSEVRFQPPELPMGEPIVWVAPIRTKPLRTYDALTSEFSPEGGHTPYLIRTTLRSKKAAIKFRNFIHEVGQASGLFQDVQIKNFGRDVTAPFEVDIFLDDKALKLSCVGYGVSQALPVLVELLDRPPGAWFAIQQPEVHLHPRAQAALGDVFFRMAAIENKRLLVETHSDFTIDRFRMNYRKTKGKKPESQILFFERREKHNTVTALSIDDSGELPEDQPFSYRDFFVREELRLLGDETV